MPAPDFDQGRWFAEEVQPHEGALRAYLRSRFSSLSAADVDDLVQEAYMRLFRSREAVATPKAYLFTIGRNRALNLLRSRRGERRDPFTENPLDGVLDEGLGIPESLAHAEELTLLLQAIQSLPDRCRQVMTLRKIYGLSQREVAAKLGISENTVETQGAIGLEKCAEFFRRRKAGRKP